MQGSVASLVTVRRVEEGGALEASLVEDLTLTRRMRDRREETVS